MKEIVPPPAPIVRNSEQASIQALFQKNIMPTYARFDIALSHGAGNYVYDVNGRRYLDLGGASQPASWCSTRKAPPPAKASS